MADAKTTEDAVQEEEQVAEEAAEEQRKEADAPDLDGFSRDRLLELLRAMLLFRRFEEKAEEAYAIGKIGGFCHLHIGQEAVAAGCILPLRDDDYVITAYREHTQAIAKGIDPKHVMAELYGKASGTSGGKGGSMHIFSREHAFLGGHGIVGQQIGLAAGVGFAIKYRGEDKVCVCFMGEAAVNQGNFHESLNMAAVWKLPVLFVVENNEFGMGTEFSRVSATEVSERASAYGIPDREVDGQDVLEVHATVDELVEEIRGGSGPHLLECKTYRFKGHSMSDPVHGVYRTKEEVQERQEEQDPIVLLRSRLMDADMLDQDELEEMDAEAKERADEAAEFADEADAPGADALYTNVYADPDVAGRLFFDGREDR